TLLSAPTSGKVSVDPQNIDGLKLRDSPAPLWWRAVCADGNVRASLCLNDFSAAHAGGADANTLVSAIDLGVYRAQVHIPAAAAHVVSVADSVTKLRPFAADITNLC